MCVCVRSRAESQRERLSGRQDIVMTLKDKLSLSRIEHFALVLEQQPSVTKLLLLHDEERIEQVRWRPSPGLFRGCCACTKQLTLHVCSGGAEERVPRLQVSVPCLFHAQEPPNVAGRRPRVFYVPLPAGRPLARACVCVCVCASC